MHDKPSEYHREEKKQFRSSILCLDDKDIMFYSLSVVIGLELTSEVRI
jgi:hypothetical protein